MEPNKKVFLNLREESRVLNDGLGFVVTRSRANVSDMSAEFLQLDPGKLFTLPLKIDAG